MPSSSDLGNPDHHVNPEPNCLLTDISVGQDNIQACLCTSPFCNYVSLESNNPPYLKSSQQSHSKGRRLEEDIDQIAEKVLSSSNKIGTGSMLINNNFRYIFRISRNY